MLAPSRTALEAGTTTSPDMVAVYPLEWSDDADRQLGRTTAIDQTEQRVQVEAVV